MQGVVLYLIPPATPRSPNQEGKIFKDALFFMKKIFVRGACVRQERSKSCVVWSRASSRTDWAALLGGSQKMNAQRQLLIRTAAIWLPE